jgi:hypothetical protein
MRSVSSANNLRKVHAKKEAERAEVEGRTPTSARSLAPAHSNPMSEDENGSGSPRSPSDAGERDGDEHDTQGRGDELIDKIYSRGSNSEGQSAGERFFPKTDHPHEPAEQGSEEPGAGETDAKNKDNHSQMTDVVMREMSEAEAGDQKERADPQEDTKMETVDEAAEERGVEKEK